MTFFFFLLDVTGPDTASKAILVIYGTFLRCFYLKLLTSSIDIFGFWPQTIQGADILSTSNEHKYKVFMPDFFEGEPVDLAKFPPKTEEDKKNLGTFFGTKAAPPKTLARLPDIVSEANSKFAPAGGAFTSWSLFGFCWGGKITSLAAGKDNKLFKAGVQCHPAMVDPNDAKAVTVPFATLASKDEDPAAIDAYSKSLQVPSYTETFSTQIHGWMAARANLEDAEVRKEYVRGYETALGFLHKYA